MWFNVYGTVKEDNRSVVEVIYASSTEAAEKEISSWYGGTEVLYVESILEVD